MNIELCMYVYIYVHRFSFENMYILYIYIQYTHPWYNTELNEDSIRITYIHKIDFKSKK